MDVAALRRLFAADQMEAAVEERAGAVLRAAGGDRGFHYRPLSQWAARVLWAARVRPWCWHDPREGVDLLYVPAQVGRVLCERCAWAVAAAVDQDPAPRPCDVCAGRSAPVVSFMFQGPTVILTGVHCSGCRPVVYGAPA